MGIEEQFDLATADDLVQAVPLSRLLAQLFAFGVFPNLLLAVCTLGLSVLRPWINFDILFFGIVALFLRPALAISGFVALMALELAIDIAPIFHFDPVAFLYTSADIQNLSFSFALLPASFWLAFPLGLMAMAVCLWRVTRSSPHRAAIILGISVLVAVSLDVANGTSTLNGKILRVDGGFAPANFVFSPLVDIVSGIHANRNNRGGTAQWVPVDSGLARGLALTHHTGPQPQNNIVLVIVESWGTMTTAPGMDDYVLKPLLSPALLSRYDVTRGVVPYRGSTTSAEIRELCGVAGSHQMLRKDHVPFCWPARLARQGYQVVALHGFRSTMFNRVVWWPIIGISRALFMGDLDRRPGQRRCGTSFRGICDTDAMAELGNQLRRGPGVFAYLLTLNSHLPIAQEEPTAIGFSCAAAPAQLTPEQCAIAARWRAVFDAAAKQASREDIGETTFVLVGDHAPPFFYRNNSAAFSHAVVPFIVLAPRRQS